MEKENSGGVDQPPEVGACNLNCDLATEESEEIKKMEFLSIPVEVIDKNILPFLEWNDLLRFRRVCKLTKAITEGYMNVHPELAPEIEIDEEEKTFGEFLKMNIPTTRIFLNNVSGDEFYQKAGSDAVEFLERFGPLVKSLRVDELSIYIHGKEWDFLEALVNLQSFEARRFGCGRPVNQSELEKVLLTKYILAKQRDQRFKKEKFGYVPKVLKQLKSLKIGNNEDLNFPDVIKYTIGFLSHGENLEYVSLPFTVDDSKSGLRDPNPNQVALAMAFRMIKFVFEDPESVVPHSPLKTLKALDFRCYPATYLGIFDEDQLEMEWRSFEKFIEVCHFCVKAGIKLMNVPAHWFMRRENFPEIVSPEFGALVVSIVNLHPCMIPMQLQNLERVEIQQTSRSNPGHDWRGERLDWPSLKSLDMTVDSKLSSIWEVDPESEMEDVVFFHTIKTKDLFDFFFWNVSRSALTELRLNFVGEAGKVDVPKTEDIVSSCPNLKKLTIINWPGTNKALTKLWDGLPELEEISLEYCKDLGNVAFVGKSTDSPVFLKLTKLKKLTLKGLDQMPKITDTLFHLVIRHMKLSHLILSSDNPVNKITQTGIESLLEGSFAGSIERFPFRDWSLVNVSKQDLKKTEEKFRSYCMF